MYRLIEERLVIGLFGKTRIPSVRSLLKRMSEKTVAQVRSYPAGKELFSQKSRLNPEKNFIFEQILKRPGKEQQESLSGFSTRRGNGAQEYPLARVSNSPKMLNGQNASLLSKSRKKRRLLFL